MTMRWDIINYLIEKYGYKNYLEIGYYKGWSFDRVNCQNKWAVDPSPSKDEYQINLPYGTTGVLNKMTSDEYFSMQNADVQYDIVFIDGLHEAGQVINDIRNSTNYLSDGGTIVLHDCNPSSYEMTTTGTPAGEWTGDVYKAFIQWRRENYGTKNFVIDTDYGVGIIKPFERWKEPEAHHSGILKSPVPAGSAWEGVPEDIDWDFFEKHKQRLLNLKSVGQAKELL